MTTRSLYRQFRILTALTIASLSSLAVQAQTAASLPPARTYHTDKYGRETRVVKERWQENSKGEKNGLYLSYDEHAFLIGRLTYVNGVINGPTMQVTDNSALVLGVPVKNVRIITGTFVNGLPDGKVTVRSYNTGVPGKILAVKFYQKGQHTAEDEYVDGKLRAHYITDPSGKWNGMAKVYGASLAEFASGNCEDGKPSGMWSNAVAVEDGVGYEAGEDDGNSTSYNRVKKYKIKYKKGGEVMFYNGAPVSPDSMH